MHVRRAHLNSHSHSRSWHVNQSPTDILHLSSIAGNTTSCLPPAPTTNITVVTNITNVETCRPVGFRVFGGQMPYNLSIAALNSPVVTNVTMGPNDDVFTFINRADPKGQFLGEWIFFFVFWGK